MSATRTLLLVVLIFFSALRNCTSGEPWAFPEDFKFGVGTSAYQVEGGWNADGKGVSNWDHLTHSNPDFVKDETNGDIACDTYTKYRSDVQLLKDLGVNHYRFSISWTRIFPKGFANNPNLAGIQYYNNLINALVENGIEPMVTLYHFDTPQALIPLGGFTNPNLIQLFEDYARTAFKYFGDRVKTWVTFNEPKVFCVDFNQYLGIVNQPFPSGIIEYQCSHTILLAHASVYSLYKREFKKTQNGKVGITLNFEWAEPSDESPANQLAAVQHRQFEVGLYLNPLVYGDYPKIVKERIGERSRLEKFPQSRLPQFTLSERLLIKQSVDFIGLNHYSTWYVKSAPMAPIGVPSFDKDEGIAKFQDDSWPSTGFDYMKVVPWGLRNSLKWLKDTYNNPEIIITECGYADLTGELNDDKRIDFYAKYLNATLQAIYEDGVNVKAFTTWSFLDNFEWAQGYTIKFGLYHVDFNNPERPRTPKKSVEYFRNVIKTRLV